MVAAAPVAAVRYCEPLCKFLGQCARCLECFSWVWLQGMWANLRLLLCCCFLTSLVRSASRERFIEHVSDGREGGGREGGREEEGREGG